jgi:hypothetical protein
MSDNIADKHAKAAELDGAIKDAAKRKIDMEGNIDKVLEKLTAISTRLDALEYRHLEGHGGPRQRSLVTGDRGEPGGGKNLPRRPQYDDDHGKVLEPGEPKAVVADSGDPNDAIFGHGRKFQPLFYDYQAAADTACRAWGAAAVPPLHGEQLLDYRRRLLRPLMKHSTQFKDVNVDELAEPLISPIERSVFADAIKASHDNSSVPEDYLREVTTTDATGRRITSFYGQPRVWLNQFSGNRRRLIGIRTNFDR